MHPFQHSNSEVPIIQQLYVLSLDKIFFMDQHNYKINNCEILINSSIYLQMQIINQLLKNTPEDLRNAYKSHLRFHLKTIMTNINKSDLEDLTKVEIRKNKCILSCYQKNQNLLKPNENSQQINNEDIIIAVEELKDCKKSCKKQQHAVAKHLDDVNFYSKRKFVGCTSKCEKKYEQILEEQKNKNGPSSEVVKQLCKPYTECMWDCYNRLDRRYKDYWKKQQDEIIKGFL